MDDNIKIVISTEVDQSGSAQATLNTQLQTLIDKAQSSKSAKIKVDLDTSKIISDANKIQVELDKIAKKSAVKPKILTETGIDITKEGAKLENIIRQYEKLKSQGVDATSSVNLLKQAFDNLKSNTALEKHTKQLAIFDTQIDVVKQDFKNLIPADALKVSTLSNEVETWMKNNKRAAKEFATQFEDLKQSLSGDVDVGSLNKANVEFKRLKSEADKAGVAGQTMGDKFSAAFKKFSTWYGVARIFTEIVRLAKKMVSEVIEIDSAMTELKKVTSETDVVYSKFLDGASERARKLGATITDIVSATADYARLGYGLKDASELADASILYKNVADGIENINDASASIVSTMKANDCLCV